LALFASGHALLNDVVQNRQKDQRTNAVQKQFSASAFPLDRAAQFHNAAFFRGAELARFGAALIRVKTVLAVPAPVRLEGQPTHSPIPHAAMRAMGAVFFTFWADHLLGTRNCGVLRENDICKSRLKDDATKRDRSTAACSPGKFCASSGRKNSDKVIGIKYLT